MRWEERSPFRAVILGMGLTCLQDVSIQHGMTIEMSDRA